jgi:membrane protein YdbS with pleckstrin-like domain
MYDQLDQVTEADEIPDRPGQRRRVGLSDAVFYTGCFALALLPATVTGVLLYDFIGEPVLFLIAVVVLTWVVTTVALVKIAGPMLRCRAIVAAGGLVSVAMCSLFLLE